MLYISLFRVLGGYDTAFLSAVITACLALQHPWSATAVAALWVARGAYNAWLARATEDMQEELQKLEAEKEDLRVKLLRVNATVRTGRGHV